MSGQGELGFAVHLHNDSADEPQFPHFSTV